MLGVRGATFGGLGRYLEPYGGHLARLGGHLGAQSPPGAEIPRKIQVKVHLEVTTPARDAPKVDFDLYFTRFFRPPMVCQQERRLPVSGGGGGTD